ncbi:MAG: hypothetical protein WBB27_12455 [Maribacter sp.]
MKKLLSIVLLLLLSTVGFSHHRDQTLCANPEGDNCPCITNFPEGGSMIIGCDDTITIKSEVLTPTSCAGSGDTCYMTINPL